MQSHSLGWIFVRSLFSVFESIVENVISNMIGYEMIGNIIMAYFRIYPQSNSIIVFCKKPPIFMLFAKSSKRQKKHPFQELSIKKEEMYSIKKEEVYSQSEHYQQNVTKNIETNTLGQLTKKFVELIKSRPEQTIEIHEASQRLQIQKRRIYDITNVLEGIGYIEKQGKNTMKWIGGIQGSELQTQLKDLENTILKLQVDTLLLEQLIEQTRKQIINVKAQYNYFITEDIQQFMKILKISKMLLYDGSLGDSIEHFDRDQSSQFKNSCVIESSSKEVKLYLCIQVENEQANHKLSKEKRSEIVIDSDAQKSPRELQCLISQQKSAEKEQVKLQNQQSIKQQQKLYQFEPFAQHIQQDIFLDSDISSLKEQNDNHILAAPQQSQIQ